MRALAQPQEPAPGAEGVVSSLGPGSASDPSPGSVSSPADEEAPPAFQDRGPVSAPAPVSTLAPELSLPQGPEAARAQSLFAVGRYVEAAVVFEAQAAKSSPTDRRFLYHASLARAKAGQHGRAAEHLRLVLRAGTLSPSLRGELGALMELSCGRASRVQLRVTESTSAGLVAPPELERGTLSLESSSTLAGDAPYRTTLSLGNTAELCLDPGAYALELIVPGYYPLRLRRVVDARAVARPWDFAVEAHKVLVDLRVFPERALRRGLGTLTLRRSDRPGYAPLVFEEIEPTTTVALPVGTWSAEAKARRYSGQRTITVVPSSSGADISMNKRRAESSKFRGLRGAVGPVVGYFGLGYAGGLGLLLGGSSGQGKRESEYEDFLTEAGVDPDGGEPLSPELVAAAEAAIPTAEYHRGLRRSVRLQTAGVTLGMHSLGFIASTLPMLTRGKKRSSYILVGVGGAVLAGGVGWMSVYAAKERELLGSDLPEDRVGGDELNELLRHRLGAGMLIGAGSGMVIGSALILTIARVRTRRSLAAAPVLGPGFGGVSVQGRF